MNILTQNYTKMLENIIKKQLNKNIDDLFKNIELDFNPTVMNFCNTIRNIDNTFTMVIKRCLKEFIEALDRSFKDSEKRKSAYHIKAYSTRCILTLFGPIEYKKTYYVNKISKESFCYIDNYLGLRKYDFVDPYLRALIIEKLASNNYQDVANSINELIEKRSDSVDYINRQYIYNIVKNMNIAVPKRVERETPKDLFIMADEKFISIQKDKNGNKKIMIKHSVVFEDIDTSNKRARLVNKKCFTKYGNGLAADVIDYICETYDVNKIDNIYVMGDGASWINNFSSNFKFGNNKLIKALDKFHYRQALKHINPSKDIQDKLHQYLIHDKKSFNELIDILVETSPHRKDTINNKRKYLLNNFSKISNLYQYKLSCPMESQISHNIAYLMSSRPKGYSIKNAQKIALLRDLKLNNENIFELALINNNYEKQINLNDTNIDLSLFEKGNHGYGYLNGEIINRTIKQKYAY